MSRPAHGRGRIPALIASVAGRKLAPPAGYHGEFREGPGARDGDELVAVERGQECSGQVVREPEKVGSSVAVAVLRERPEDRDTVGIDGHPGLAIAGAREIPDPDFPIADEDQGDIAPKAPVEHDSARAVADPPGLGHHDEAIAIVTVTVHGHESVGTESATEHPHHPARHIYVGLRRVLEAPYARAPVARPEETILSRGVEGAA